VFLTDTVLLTCGQVCRRATRDQRRDLITLVGMPTVNSPDDTLKVALHSVYITFLPTAWTVVYVAHAFVVQIINKLAPRHLTVSHWVRKDGHWSKT